jgi:hypothetical protein
MVDSYGRRAGSERTLSALDTAGLAASRVSQLRQLARAITEYAQSAAGKTELQAVAQSVLRDPDADDDFADAADLAQRLQTTSDPQIRMLGQQLAVMLSSSLDAPALVHVSSGPASGISIYFPRSAQTVDAYLTGGAFAADTGWADAVRAIW